MVTLLITAFGCKKNTEKKIPIVDLNSYLKQPYKGDETVIFYSGNSQFVTHINKTTEQWPGWTGDTIYTSEIIQFDADGYKPCFYIRLTLELQAILIQV